MLDSVQMTLLIGPGMPIPAPRVVSEALLSVQITSGGDRTGFQIKFAMSKKSPLQTTMLPAGFFDPIITRVIVVVTIGGVPETLVDGVITRQEMAPSNVPGQSVLTITGEDLSVLMGVVELTGIPYPAMPVPVIVLTVLARYAVFGVIPIVIPPLFGDNPSPTEKIPTQNGTDLDYIKQLATRCGYAFYLEPGPAPGTSLAYFGPKINAKYPVPQPALNVNMDQHTNVESLSFSLDGLAKKIVVVNILDPVTKKIVIPIPLPNIDILNPPLGARLTPPSKVEFSKEEAKETTVGALLKALARAAGTSDSVTGTGALNVLRYGRPLHARRTVGVRGAGLAYDGLYYVKSVTHNIKRGEYKQSFALSRDGLVSPTPVVP
jgi:hypothetical protein